MTKLIKIASALALASTLAVTGCKKKDEAAPEATPPAPTTAKPGEGTDPAAAAPTPTTPPAAAPTTPPAADPAAAGAAAAGGSGIAECDSYFAAFETLSKCDKLPAAAIDAMKQGIEAMKQSSASWKTLPPEALKTSADGCKAAEDALKNTASSVGC